MSNAIYMVHSKATPKDARPDVNKQKSPKEQAQSLAGSEVEVNKLNLRFHNTADTFPRPVLGSFEEEYANELEKFFDTSTLLAHVIRDFVTAVTTDRLASIVNAVNATDYTQDVCGALYIQALEDMPGEYSSICGDLMKGRPAALYVPSFTRLRTFLARMATLVDGYDEGSVDGGDEFESSSVMAARLFSSV
ncbi:hypothetical protein N7527_008076 [Penicillium freii]|nr:hypothetical protein N7527_008076 [Penicillium freii]